MAKGTGSILVVTLVTPATLLRTLTMTRSTALGSRDDSLLQKTVAGRIQMVLQEALIGKGGLADCTGRLGVRVPVDRGQRGRYIAVGTVGCARLAV